MIYTFKNYFLVINYIVRGKVLDNGLVNCRKKEFKVLKQTNN